MSDVSELVKRARKDSSKQDIVACELTLQMADALTAQQAEIERLREALEAIAKSPVKARYRDDDLYATGMNDGRKYCANVARAALTGKEDGDG